ncbi:MAG: 6-bladed beta-propeller [Tannerella sp.]|jgi:hypothetical protein|nr:6-bladed beta-propeller [Tannerella sp.]
MTKEPVLLIIALAFAACFSCKGEGKTAETAGKKIPVIDIEKAMNHLSDEKLNFSEFVDDIVYVPLETTDESVIGGRREPPLYITENFIFYGNMLFGRDGSFVRKLGRVGQGPGEYLLARGTAADEKRQEFYVLDNFNDGIYVYDFDNRFKKRIQASDMGFNLFPLNNGKILLLRDEPSPSTDFDEFYEYRIFDMDTGETLFTRISGIKEDEAIANKRNLIWHYNREISYYEGATDTIFSLNKNGEIDSARYYVNFGKYKYKYPDKEDRLLRMDEIVETSGYLFFSVSKGFNLYYGAYNKQTGETVLNKFDEFFNNDIDGGFTWLFMDTSDGRDGFYSVLPHIARERIGTLSQQNRGYDREKNQKLRQLIDSVKEDDNQIYFFFKLK